MEQYVLVIFGVHVLAVDKRNKEWLFTTSITFFFTWLLI